MFSFSPSARKPALVLESWKGLGILFAEQSFKPIEVDDFVLAHDREYVEGVLSCRLENGYDNRNREFALALPWIAGSMVAAATHSFSTRELSFSPTSGAHHACYASGGDFCTFNFLVISAIKVRQTGARLVGIIDLDYHYGNGTDDILERLGLTYIRHYSSGGDQDARSPNNAERWLKRLPGIIREFADVDLIIYNAGVDSHVNDPLGGNLTTEQMARRDRIVFETACEMDIPVCTSLAGGYQISPDGSLNQVLSLHNTTFISAWEIFESPEKKMNYEKWNLW